MRPNNKRAIVFVGAGASRACGYPVTADILPRVIASLENGEFLSGKMFDEPIQKHAKPLVHMLRLLVPQTSGYVPQITEVLSILDHCIASGEELFPESRDVLKLSDARWLLERAMARVIRRMHPKREAVPLDIMRWIRGLRRKFDVSILSTNYDFSLDRVLFQEMGNWDRNYLKTDFGFTWRDPDDGELVHPSPNALLRLYKLHGSLNWLGCNRCGNIYVSFERTLVTLADGTGKWSKCECGYMPLRAVLVAPSFVRQYRDRNLLSVWRAAAEALRLADEWFFIGYSLPTEDVAIRALLLRALLSRSKAPRTIVVSASLDALDRYRQLFPSCKYTASGLKVFLDGEAVWSCPIIGSER
jgi:NAD-dependent SIR2 family protein deacetylase